MPFTLIGLSFQHQIDINLIAVPLASKKTVAHTNARVGMTQSFSRLVFIKAAKVIHAKNYLVYLLSDKCMNCFVVPKQYLLD